MENWLVPQAGSLGVDSHKSLGREEVIDERQYIKKALYQWVTAVVEKAGRTEPVVWDNDEEGGPRPPPPFISLEFVGGSTPGLPHYSMVKVNERVKENGEKEFDDGEQIIRQKVRKSLTMYSFGEGAADLLETVRASIFIEEYQNALYKKGLVIPEALDVKEVPRVRGTKTENSAMFDFVLTFVRQITVKPGWIEHVEYGGSKLGDMTVEKKTEGENG
jgi:hypothetical protein